MKKVFKQSAIVALGVLLCQGLEAANDEKISLEATEYITINDTPDNLVNNNGVVPVGFTLTVPNRAIKADYARVYKPVLVNGGWRQELPAIIVKGTNYDVVKQDEYTFRESSADKKRYYGSYVKPMFKSMEVPYQIDLEFHPSMRGAQLEVESEELTFSRGREWWRKSKEVESFDEINNGVIDYSNLLKYDQPLYLHSDKIQNESLGLVSIFNVRSTEVDKEVFDGPFADFVSRVKALQSADSKIESIEITVAASIEGSLSLNQELAEGREKSIKQVVDAAFPDLASSGVIRYNHKDENWDDFERAIKNESYYDAIAPIINSDDDPDVKERRLLSTKYRSDILDICHNLRNFNAKISYSAPYEIKKVGEFASSVSAKDLNGKRESVRNSNDLFEQNKIMVSYMNEGDYIKAFRVYQQMDDMTPSVANNVGVLLTFLGDYPMAEYYFGLANGVAARDYNLAMMYMHAKRYTAAADTFGNMTYPNAIIANLAAKRYTKASTLSRSSEYASADVLYLRSLAYSYTESDEITLFTLSEACTLDSKYRDYAKNQAEFIPLRTLESFKKIVK